MMIRELLGFCLPVLLHTPFVDPLEFRSFDEARYGWSARLVWLAEDVYFRNNREYGGKIVGLTEDTITVQLGRRIPRTFFVALPLLSDRIPLTHGPGMGYRLRDVQLGDWVDLDVVPVHGGIVCYGIGIFRRPGGVIPPGDDPPDMPEHSRRHHYYNARQFGEERVLPILPQLFKRVTVPLVK